MAASPTSPRAERNSHLLICEYTSNVVIHFSAHKNIRERSNDCAKLSEAKFSFGAKKNAQFVRELGGFGGQHPNKFEQKICHKKLQFYSIRYKINSEILRFNMEFIETKKEINMSIFDELIKLDETGNIRFTRWIEWRHRSIGLIHCSTCVALDKCWFLDMKKPKHPQHNNCHC